MIRYIFTVLLSFLLFQGISQNLTSSNLPILIVNTAGAEIVDEPKVDATLKIFYNEDGSRNDVHSNQIYFQGKIGIELRGQSSQYVFPKKGFGIETRELDGSDKNVSLFGMPEENDWVIHSPYSDKSLIRNALSYYFAGQIMAYAPRIQLCELIINDEYYGLVLFTEKIKRDKNRVDVSKLRAEEISGDDLTGGYIIKFDKGSGSEVGWVSPYKPIEGAEQETRFLYHYPSPEDIVPEQQAYIRSFITAFEDALMSDDFRDPVSGYSRYIDATTFIDLMLINEMTRNVDAYRLSTYLYKDKDSQDGRLKAGPVWDFNLALGNANYCEGGNTEGWAWDFNDFCPGDYWVNHVWWKRFLEDPEFTKELRKRWTSLRQGRFSNENLTAVVDSMTAVVSEAQARNFQKWPVLSEWVWPNNYVGNTFQAEINYLRTWLLDRVAWMDGQLFQSTNSTQTILNKEGINVYPNPATDEVIFEVIGSEIKNFHVEIYDAYARQVYRSELVNSSGRVVWNSNLSSGLYFYTFRTGKGIVASGRLQIVKPE